MIYRKFSQTIALLLTALFGLAGGEPHAALPDAVDGKPLPSLAPMVERVTPAVVNIATTGRSQVRSNPLLNDPFFRRFFNFPQMPQRRKPQSLGSGVIVDAKRGLILTNNHVIANAETISVKLRDGRRVEAELVGSDPDTDLAVIRIDEGGLTAIRLADSAGLKVGDFVVAVGNPFGLGQTVTSGIVSALARSGLGITGYDDLIQTDASINPGNSGGALVNLRGELVGINTAIYSQSGGNIGIGFAIPINMARQVMDQLVEYGEVKRGFLGAQLQDLNPELAEAFGISVNQGAVIVNVYPDSAAERGGLAPGDVVTKVNDRDIRDANDLRNQVGLNRVGSTLALDVLRDGAIKKLKVVVGERESARGNPVVHNERLSGTTFAEITDASPHFGRIRGVAVQGVQRGSRTWQGGLREGDIVVAVNRRRTHSLAAFLEIVNRSNGDLLFRILRGRSAHYIVIR